MMMLSIKFHKNKNDCSRSRALLFSKTLKKETNIFLNVFDIISGITVFSTFASNFRHELLQKCKKCFHRNVKLNLKTIWNNRRVISIIRFICFLKSRYLAAIYIIQQNYATI